MIHRLISQYPVWRITGTGGYFGVEGREIDATMDKSVRDHKLPMESIRRNMRITRKRSLGERPYSVIKTIFHSGHAFVANVPGGRGQEQVHVSGHNLMCMIWVKKKGGDSVSYGNSLKNG